MRYLGHLFFGAGAHFASSPPLRLFHTFVEHLVLLVDLFPEGARGQIDFRDSPRPEGCGIAVRERFPKGTIKPLVLDGPKRVRLRGHRTLEVAKGVEYPRGNVRGRVRDRREHGLLRLDVLGELRPLLPRRTFGTSDRPAHPEEGPFGHGVRVASGLVRRGDRRGREEGREQAEEADQQEEPSPRFRAMCAVIGRVVGDDASVFYERDDGDERRRQQQRPRLHPERPSDGYRRRAK